MIRWAGQQVPWLGPIMVALAQIIIIWVHHKSYHVYYAFQRSPVFTMNEHCGFMTSEQKEHGQSHH